MKRNTIQETLNIIERYVLLQAKEALDVNDVALLTGWTTASIYNMVYKRAIPFYKHNRSVRFRKSEINEWLLSNRQSTVEELNSKAIIKTIK